MNYLVCADVLAHEIGEGAFRTVAEVVIMLSFLGHHEAPCAVAGVEPLAGGSGNAARAVEAHPRTHLDERPALRKFGGLLVVHANQGDPLVAAEDVDGTDRHLIAGAGLSNGAPVSCGDNHQTDYERGSKHDHRENDERFLQRLILPEQLTAHTLGQKNDSVNP